QSMYAGLAPDQALALYAVITYMDSIEGVWFPEGGMHAVPAALAKAGGNYLSSQLIGMEAKRLGFAEGIGLAPDGTVSEGAGENLFIVKNGVLLTPSLAHSVLGGLTRDTVMMLAKEHGLEVRESAVPREMLYLADELFFTGTATEIAPIRSVDGLTVGNGKRGPITAQLQAAFFGLFSGKTNDKWQWLDLVDMKMPITTKTV
ncbi:MAG TPA: aminotransferase class IV, partial [Steroidobacteraceae bacterium]|nr:aminotransferase class IV [Steroidobacteraceae bacterium]